MKINGVNPTEDIKVELETEDVTAFIANNPEYVANLLGTDIGVKAVQPKLDQHFSKSLETWKANNLDKIVEERVQALFPNESPQARQMKELQAQIDKINKEKMYAEMSTKTLNILSDEGLPNNFAKFLQGSDEVSTRSNVSEFKFAFDQALNGKVDGKFKQFGHQPQVNTSNETSKTVDVTKMSYADRMSLYNNNPKEYERLFG